MRSSVLTVICALALMGAIGATWGTGEAGTGITLALTPSKDPTLLQEAGTALAQELGKRLDLPIKLYVAADYAGVIEALRSQTVDLAFVHPVAYVLANREARARILVKSVRGGSASYTARFFVLKDSGVRTVEDLRGRRPFFPGPMTPCSTPCCGARWTWPSLTRTRRTPSSRTRPSGNT